MGDALKLARRWQCAIVGLALLPGAASLRANARVDSRTAQSAHAASNEIIDEVGHHVKVPAEVKRIVTLAPDLAETVYSLGLGDRLVGDTNFSDTPPEAKSKPHVGNPQNPSLEAIAGLHPDLVLASGSINIEGTVDSLERLGIPVYTSDPHTVLEMLDSVARMSDIMGAGAQGRGLVTQLRQRLDALHSKLSERPLEHVLFVVWEEPLISIGQNTFIADALRWAGAESIISSDRNWPQISLEEVIRLQPDYLVFTSDHEGAEAASSFNLEDLRAQPIWKGLQAVQLGRVIDVDEEIVRPSPGLVGAIERLARQLHPEAFARNAVNAKSAGSLHAARVPPCALGAGASLPSQAAAPCAR